MKKIILFLSLTIGILASCNTKTNAQIGMYRNTDTTSSGTATASTITTGTSDSLHDANTLYSFYTKVGAFSNHKESKVKITFNVTKISGTGTARVYFQGSNDGKVWRNINVGTVGTDGYNSDTLAIAAGTTTPGVNYEYHSADGQAVYRPTINSAVHYVNSGHYIYLRAKIVGSGTQLTVYSNFKVYVYN